MAPVTYIRDIPLTERHQMCRMLDVSHLWMTLAALLNFTNDDVQSFKRAIYRPAGSPTDEMLTVWDYGCHTVTELFQKLYEMKHARCMMLLKDFVDPALHHLIREVQGVQPTEEEPVQEYPGHPQLPPVQFPHIPGAGSHIALPQDAKKPQHDDQSQGQTKPQAVQGSWNPHQERKEGLTANIDKSSEKVTGLESPFKGWQGEQAGSSSSIDNKSGMRGGSASSGTASSTLDKARDKVTMEDYENQSALSSLLHMEYSEIRQATRNFSAFCKLGEGSFGTVYHARIDMSHYAVKCLKKNDYIGMKTEEIARTDQMKELRALVRYRHPNIVALMAYCCDGPSLCLLYEYMENGSLEDNLLCKAQRAPLTWRMRHKIAEGAAKGINFLHKAQDQPLIHGDIKSANILLDKHFEPKIADFGLARLGPENGKTYCYLKTKNAHGTLPYLPEEYKRNYKLSTKVDVYSFGVVLMEILAGERVADSRREPNKLLTDIVDEAMDIECPQGVIGKIRDRRCPDWPWDIAWHLLELALICTRAKFKTRPEIDQTVKILMDIAQKITERDNMQQKREVEKSSRKSPEVFAGSFYDEAPTQRYSSPKDNGAMGYPAPVMGPQDAPMRRDLSMESNNAMVGPGQSQDPRFEGVFQKHPMQPDQRHYQYTQVYGGQKSEFEAGIRRHTSSETSDENNSSLSNMLPLYDLSSQMNDPSMCTPLIMYPSVTSSHQSHSYDSRQPFQSQYSSGYPGQTLQRYPQQTPAQNQNPRCSTPANASTQPQPKLPRRDGSYAPQLPVVVSSFENPRHQKSLEDQLRQLDISQLPTKPMESPLPQGHSKNQQSIVVPSAPKREPEQNTDILPSYQPHGMTERLVNPYLVSTISEESDEEGTVLKSSLTTAEMRQYLPGKREPTQQTENMQGGSTGQLTKALMSAPNPDVTTPATTRTATAVPASSESQPKVSDPLGTSLTTSQMRQFLPSKREPTEETERLPGEEATAHLNQAFSSEVRDGTTPPPPSIPSKRAPTQNAGAVPTELIEERTIIPKLSLKTLEMQHLVSGRLEPSQGTEKIPEESEIQSAVPSNATQCEPASADVRKIHVNMERGFDVQTDRCHSVPFNMAAIVPQGCAVSTKKTPQQMTEPLNSSN